MERYLYTHNIIIVHVLVCTCMACKLHHSSKLNIDELPVFGGYSTQLSLGDDPNLISVQVEITVFVSSTCYSASAFYATMP